MREEKNGGDATKEGHSRGKCGLVGTTKTELSTRQCEARVNKKRNLTTDTTKETGIRNEQAQGASEKKNWTGDW